MSYYTKRMVKFLSSDRVTDAHRAKIAQVLENASCDACGEDDELYELECAAFTAAELFEIYEGELPR